MRTARIERLADGAVAGWRIGGRGWSVPAVWQSLLLVLVALALGLVVAISATAALAVAAMPLAAAIYSREVRFCIVVFGGLLLFDSSDGLSLAKGLYLASLSVCFVGAWTQIMRVTWEGSMAGIPRLAGIAFWVVALVVAVSLPVAILNEHSIEVWVRDVAPYALLAMAPILALDASRSSGRFLLGAFVLAGTLVTAAASLQLIGLRGLRSDVLLWSVLAGLVLAGLWLPGSRSSLLLVGAPVGMLVFSRSSRGIQRVAALAALATILIVAIFSIGPRVGLDTGAAQERLLTAGPAIEAPRENGSLRDRFAQSQAAWDLLQQAPVLGVGPGQTFEWYTPSGAYRSAFAVDSTVSTIAKFGIVGTAGLLVYFGLLWHMLAGTRIERATLVGLAAWGALAVIISNPLEDKGLAFGLLFVLALGLRQRAATGPPYVVAAGRADPGPTP
ncbi:MAG: hypothetical protein LC798_21420 [Chloroflexi bacterium]|nr:hypothetical protein [Chloroflexota bacterium]